MLSKYSFIFKFLRYNCNKKNFLLKTVWFVHAIYLFLKTLQFNLNLIWRLLFYLNSKIFIFIANKSLSS